MGRVAAEVFIGKGLLQEVQFHIEAHGVEFPRSFALPPCPEQFVFVQLLFEVAVEQGLDIVFGKLAHVVVSVSQAVEEVLGDKGKPVSPSPRRYQVGGAQGVA